MTTQGELPDIVERLRAKVIDANHFDGKLMKEWDAIRAACLQHRGSDLPRLMFEGQIENFTELLTEAADLIERLRATPPGSPLEREGDATVDEQEFLRGLVDWVYLHATEGEQWPSTYTAEALITAAHQGKPTQANANAYKTLATPSPSPTEREGE